jgi:hypothetical protein
LSRGPRGGSRSASSPPILLAKIVLLLCLAPACSQHEPGAPSARRADPNDPYVALRGLGDGLARMADRAEADPASQVPNGRGEGALHVLRLMRRAIDEEIAWADTAHPFFQAQDERYAKLALGNPDNLYLVARTEDGATYRIHGRLGTTSDFNLQVYQGYPGVHRPMQAHGALGLDRLVTDAKGRFEIFVGGPERGPNWIPLHPGSRRLLVRFTYGDWTTEEAGEIAIERVDAGGRATRPVDDATVARRIAAATAYLEDAMTGYQAVVAQVYDGLAPNALRPIRRMSGDAGGLSSQYNATGRYAVDDEHALIVTTRPSDAGYQGFQIGTEWFEALDFVNRTTSFNTRQARLSSDGFYHFVIATRDPGVANWLDASEAPQGQMLLRWQRARELGPGDEPRLRLVAFEELRRFLPQDEPVFTSEARRAQIAQRQQAIARRYGLSRR